MRGSRSMSIDPAGLEAALEPKVRLDAAAERARWQEATLLSARSSQPGVDDKLSASCEAARLDKAGGVATPMKLLYIP